MLTHIFSFVTMEFQEILAHDINVCLLAIKLENIIVDDVGKVNFENYRDSGGLPGHSLLCDPEQIISICPGFGFFF